jgi:hypothetical protein
MKITSSLFLLLLDLCLVRSVITDNKKNKNPVAAVTAKPIPVSVRKSPSTPCRLSSGRETTEATANNPKACVENSSLVDFNEGVM